MRRVFFAIRIPKPLIQSIETHFLQPLHSHPFLKLVEKDNLHITLHFVGEIIEEQYEVLLDDFLHMEFPSPQLITVGGNKNVDRFGQRVLFVHVHNNSILRELHEACYALFPKDNTAFKRHNQYHPHITLARNDSKHELNHIIAQLNHFQWSEEFIPLQVTLLESIQEKGKTRYVERAKVGLE